MLHQAVEEMDGPVAIRYPRGGEERYRECCGTKVMTKLREGKDCTIVSYGTLINEALGAADILQKKGLEAAVVKINRIAPLDTACVKELLGETKCLLVLEDCVNTGCVGQRLAATMVQIGIAPQKLILKNSGDAFVQQGTIAQLYRALGLDAQSVAEAVEEVLHGR